MVQIKGVIFDLGRVLLDLDLSRGLFRHLVPVGNNSDETINSIVKDELFKEYNSGRLTPEEFHARFRNRTGLELGFADFCREWCDIFSMNDGIRQIFTEVDQRVKVGILSDTDPLHWNRVLEDYPLLRAATNPTLSYEQGIMKPDPDIYRRAAANLGLKPGECFYTDDLEANIEGAKSVGMHAVLYRGPDLLRSELELAGVL